MRDSVVVIRLEEEYRDVELYYILWAVQTCEKQRSLQNSSLSIKKTCITGFLSHYKGNKSVVGGGGHRDEVIERE